MPRSKAGTSRRLDSDDAIPGTAAELGAKERQHQAGEVGSPAGAADKDVGLIAGEGHLLHGLQAQHGLVKEHVVEHRAEGVLGVVALRGDFDGFRDGDAERSGMIGIAREDGSAGLRFPGG